jgi:hypothetical protein
MHFLFLTLLLSALVNLAPTKTENGRTLKYLLLQHILSYNYGTWPPRLWRV